MFVNRKISKLGFTPSVGFNEARKKNETYVYSHGKTFSMCY